MKKTVSSQRRGLPFFPICRGPCTQRERFTLTSSQVLSCLLKEGCGGSPLLQMPILFGQLGISDISWPKIWGRGESHQWSDFTTGAKVCEHVRKPTCLLSQRARGRQEVSGAWGASVTNTGCVTGRGQRRRALCASDCIRQYMMY